MDGCPSSPGIFGTLVGFPTGPTIPVLRNHLLFEKHSLYFHISNHQIPKCLEIANIDFLFRAHRTQIGHVYGRLISPMSQVLHMNLFQVYNWPLFLSFRLAFYLQHYERKIFRHEAWAPILESLENQCCCSKAFITDSKIS